MPGLMVVATFLDEPDAALLPAERERLQRFSERLNLSEKRAVSNQQEQKLTAESAGCGRSILFRDPL